MSFLSGSLSSIPQLRIPRNLPRLSGLNSSPATLYLCGGMHIIVLDGPDDGELRLPLLQCSCGLITKGLQ